MHSISIYIGARKPVSKKTKSNFIPLDNRIDIF